MNLMLTGDTAKQVVELTKNDNNLAELMARQLLTAIDAQTMAPYLLTDELVLELLSERVAAAPEATLHELQQLATGKTVRPSSAHTRVAVKTRTRARARSGKRVRMTSAEVAAIKDRVLEVLRDGPANRTRLRQAVEFPSIAVYTRIMGELRAEGVVTAQGQRRMAVYLLARRRARR